MSKVDVVQSVLDALVSGAKDAIGVGYDSAFADGVASVPAVSDDVAAAVAKAQADDAVALSEAVSAVQSELDAMSAKDNADVSALAAVQAKLDQIKALLS